MSTPDVSKAICTTAINESLTQYPLPNYLIKSVDLVGKIYVKAHLITKISELRKIFIRDHETKSVNSFVIGAALDVGCSLTDVTEYALTILLITQAVSNVVEQHQELYVTYQNLQDSIHDRFPKLVTSPLETAELTVISPSFKKKIDENYATIPEYLWRTTESLVFLCNQIFKTSLRYQDLRLIINGDPNQRIHACTTLVARYKEFKNVEGQEVTFNDLKDQRFLAQEINNNNILVDKILTQINKSTKASNIFNMLTEAANAQPVQEFMANVNQVNDGVIGNPHAPVDPLGAALGKKHKKRKKNNKDKFPPWAGQHIEVSTPSPFYDKLASKISITPEKLKNGGLLVAQVAQVVVIHVDKQISTSGPSHLQALSAACKIVYWVGSSLVNKLQGP